MFRAWLFKAARNAACRYYARRSRQVPAVGLTEMAEVLPAVSRNPLAASEFKDWMKFLDKQKSETMTLRFK